MSYKLRELVQAISDADIACDRLGDELESIEAERDALEKERDELLEAAADLRAELAERDARITALELDLRGHTLGG